MLENIAEAISRLIRYQRAPDSATTAFRTMKHNSHLLPKLQQQLETLFEAHRKFEPVVYDTQGIHDDGSDIVVRYAPPDAVLSLIGFQVKSFDDLAKKTYLQELKAQRDDTFRKVSGLQKYYIVVCTDTGTHRDKVRSIAAEFRSAHLTELVEPAYAFTFLHHRKTRVEALVKRLHEADAIVFFALCPKPAMDACLVALRAEPCPADYSREVGLCSAILSRSRAIRTEQLQPPAARPERFVSRTALITRKPPRDLEREPGTRACAIQAQLNGIGLKPGLGGTGHRMSALLCGKQSQKLQGDARVIVAQLCAITLLPDEPLGVIARRLKTSAIHIHMKRAADPHDFGLPVRAGRLIGFPHFPERQPKARTSDHRCEDHVMRGDRDLQASAPFQSRLRVADKGFFQGGEAIHEQHEPVGCAP